MVLDSIILNYRTLAISEEEIELFVYITIPNTKLHVLPRVLDKCIYLKVHFYKIYACSGYDLSSVGDILNRQK